eukprot:11161460-Lingulodinium_polyedra.AAC.1
MVWRGLCMRWPRGPAGAVASSRGQDPLQAQYTWCPRKDIGSGAFGKVVEGTRLVDNRNYASKHVDATEVEWRFEYELLSDMRHDNVLRAVG